MPTVSKGTVLQVDVAATLTAVAEVKSIDISDAESETYDASYLTQTGSGRIMLANGYSTAPKIAAEVWWGPTETSHQALTDEIATPSVTAATQLDGKVIYADSGTTELPFKIAGVKVGQKIAMEEGVVGNIEFQCNQQPTWPT